MSRSTWTNAFIRNLYATPNIGPVWAIDEEGDRYICKDFRALADLMDSVDEISIDTQRGWFTFNLNNDGEEQLHDYTANAFCEVLVISTKITGDE